MSPALAEECAVRVEAPVSVDPAVSTTFNVSIIAENVPSPGFYGWEVNVTWTPGKINCTTEYLNYDLWGGYYLGPWVTDPIDNVAGVYHQSFTGRYPGNPETGTRWLVNLTFIIVEPDGYSITIYISPWAPAQYCIADKNAQQIPHAFIPATLDIIPEFHISMVLPLFMIVSIASVLISKTLDRKK
jgi:hypothetical protein